MTTKVNKPTEKSYKLKKLKKRVGTGDGGLISKKGKPKPKGK